MPPEQSLPLYKHPATCFFAVALVFIGLPLRTTFPARDADVQVRQQGSL